MTEWDPTSRSTWASPALRPFPHIHLDLYAHDQVAEVERLVGLGARRVTDWPYPDEEHDYVVLEDPDGNRFCVIDAAPGLEAPATADGPVPPDGPCRRTGRREPSPGSTNSLTDVPGIRVGHATRREDGWLTGTTVVLAPDAGAVAGVDVRGGAPGTRETDLLDPGNLVDLVNAVVLTGGSAFGLAAADGVMQGLYAAGSGVADGRAGRGGPHRPCGRDLRPGPGWRVRPRTHGFRRRRCLAVASADGGVQGCVGAGTGARSAGLKGAVGSASAVLDDGTTVAALVVVNSFGAPYDEQTGELLARRHGLGNEFGHVGLPAAHELEAARERAAAAYEGLPFRPGMATTIGVIATDADADQGSVPEGQRARSRRPGQGAQPGAHAARRRRPVHPRDG